MGQSIKRVLVYTHNSIGLGHAFRTRAVITGIQKIRPDINFLVISSTSVPQIFFEVGIEVIKLPSVKLDINREDNPMIPRYLSDFDLESIFDFRQRMILETFDFFKPDALIVEHNMTGQMSELIPLLMKKWMRKGGPADFALAHVCRGIMRWIPLLEIPYENPRHRSESINIGGLYDFMYVLEDREVIDINKAFLGNDPELERKIRYLGKITNKVREELPPREAVLERFGISDKKIILISLGRNRQVEGLTEKLLSDFAALGLDEEWQVVVVLDPYLDKSAAERLTSRRHSRNTLFMSFLPDLVDLVRHSRLVISRAGYNTVNEILLCGTPAVIIPESHGSREQEERAKALTQANIRVLTEEDAMSDAARGAVQDLLDNSIPQRTVGFDKYAIGKSIIEDMERWKAQSGR